MHTPTPNQSVTHAAIRRVRLFPLAIPLRGNVRHATSERRWGDPVVVAVELQGGAVGYGETVPRPYVSGEDVSSVLDALKNPFAKLLTEFRPTSFPQALEAIDALPWRNDAEALIPAARAAVELALLDASMRFFCCDMDDIVGWMGLPGFGSPGSIKRLRFSGVLAAEDLATTSRQLRRMYWAGLRDFKLKVGVDGDRERLECAATYLRRAVAAGKASLRLDANGAWSRDEAVEWLRAASRFPIASVEQPLARGREDELPSLRSAVSIPFMHDESLITEKDARRLIDLGVADGFNIRISKCGGLMPSLRLGALARRAGARIQLGCMVGETSILSAVGLRFLQTCPGVSWAEGCFGTLLLRADVTARSLRFGLAGRVPRLRGPGLGVDVDPERLRALCDRDPLVLDF